MKVLHRAGDAVALMRRGASPGIGAGRCPGPPPGLAVELPIAALSLVRLATPIALLLVAALLVALLLVSLLLASLGALAVLLVPDVLSLITTLTLTLIPLASATLMTLLTALTLTRIPLVVCHVDLLSLSADGRLGPVHWLQQEFRPLPRPADASIQRAAACCPPQEVVASCVWMYCAHRGSYA